MLSACLQGDLTPASEAFYPAVPSLGAASGSVSVSLAGANVEVFGSENPFAPATNSPTDSLPSSKSDKSSCKMGM